MENVVFNQCIEDIKYYFDNTDGGLPYFVNVEDWDKMQALIGQLEADDSKTIIRISDFTQDNKLPAVDEAINYACKEGKTVLIGLAQACYLHSPEKMKEYLSSLLNKNISGHLLIITIACHEYLSHAIKHDHRLLHRITLTTNSAIVPRFPSFILANIKEQINSNNYLDGCKKWMKYLENLSSKQAENTIDVYTKKTYKIFSNSKYFIKAAQNIFEIIERNYSELTGKIKESYGTDNQWKWLLEQLRNTNSFSAVLENVFGTHYSVSNTIINISADKNNLNTDRYWLAWLALKVFGAKDNRYLDIVSRKCSNSKKFIDIFIHYLVNVDYQQGDFEELYQLRKTVLSKWDIDESIMSEFCQSATIYEKNEILYLTDLTAIERLKFLESLERYHLEWNRKDLLYNIRNRFSSIYEYMKESNFSNENIACSSERTDIIDTCNRYFSEYKWFKLCNYIDDDFLSTVNKLAIERIYTSIKLRSTIVKLLSDKDSSRLYFFDAFGVEYLPYFVHKCEENKIFVDTTICSCNLPSITIKNKEFENYFNDIKKISYLDELKHHSQEYDYEKCQLPIHLFAELKVIDDAIVNFANDLKSGEYKKVYVVADHGASRLAVIHNHYNKSSIEMEERGKHSGRCCPLSENPDIEYACFEDGYAVLANYDRFKGSRLADVEVHGGATLEEVLVPVITLSLEPKEIIIRVINPIIYIKNGNDTILSINSNGIIKKPYIYIDGNVIEGKHRIDNHNIDFNISQLKKAKSYSFDIYDGYDNISNDISLAKNISFTLKKKMVSKNDMFDL